MPDLEWHVAPQLVREELMRVYFRNVFWKLHQASPACESWNFLVMSLENVAPLTQKMTEIENWLQERRRKWAWKAVLATPTQIRITFFFEQKNDAILFKLMFS